jgi:ParB family chromosome partitioning protein
MGKLDELKRSMGANVIESASRRETPAGTTASHLPSLSSARMSGVARSKNALDIPLDRIYPDPDQPREDFDEASLERLAESLKTRGQLQPVRVRFDEGRGEYILICGERRWRAARMAGLPTLACVVSEGVIDAGELLALQLIENCVREDLQPIEQARAYRTLIDRTGWSGNRLAQELGIAQSSVVHALALLALPTAVQEQVEERKLSPSTAYEISKIEDSEAQRNIAALAVAEGLTRAEVVEAVRETARQSKGRGGSKTKPKAKKVTIRTFRTGDGFTVTIECKRGLDLATMLASAEKVAQTLRQEMSAVDTPSAA